VARAARVFIDTNELFPFTVMDTLLTLAEELVITWVWTDELLAEWERVIVQERQRTAETAASVVGAVRTAFGRGRLEPERYLPLLDDSLSADPDDRVHVAACLGGDVDVLLTRNTRDFPLERLMDAGVAVLSADDYLVALLRRRRTAVLDAVKLTASRKKNPPKTSCEFVRDLLRAGTPQFAERVGASLGCEGSSG
jgi:hypothetical protein